MMLRSLPADIPETQRRRQSLASRGPKRVLGGTWRSSKPRCRRHGVRGAEGRDAELPKASRGWGMGTGYPLTHCFRHLPVVSCYQTILYKKLSYRRVTARCVLSVVILPIATQQCRNYLYDKSWPNWWYVVGGLVGGNVSWTMCTQPWRDRVGSHCLSCHKQTDDGRIVYITCIPTTCCGEIF